MVGPRREPGVEYLPGLVGERPAVGDAPPGGVDLAHGEDDRPDRGLGGAAQAHHLEARQRAAGAVGEVQGDPVARQQGEAEITRPLAGRRPRGEVLDQHLQQSRHGVPEGHPLGREQARPGRRVAPRAGLGEDHGAARGEHAEEVPYREVEAERGEGEHAVLRADVEPAVDVGQGVDRGAVLDRHPLGLAGRAGGEDHVGEVGRGGLRQRAGGRRRGGAQEAALGDRQRLDSGRPVQGGEEARLGEGDAHLAARQQVVATRAGQLGVDRQVGGAGAQDAERGDGLLPALLHDHRHQLVAGAGTQPGEEAAGHRLGLGGQLAVGEPAAAREHGGPAGRLGGAGQEAPVKQLQGAGGERGRRAVDRGPAGELRGGRLHRRRQGPVVRLRQPAEQAPVGGEHVVQQAVGEQLVDRVPDQDQRPRLLRDHVVEPDLGGLGDAVVRLVVAIGCIGCTAAQLGLRAGAGHPLEVEGAGEDHRHGGAQAAARAAGELAQHPHAAHLVVVEVGPELLLELPRPLLEGGALHTTEFQQHGRGEVAEQAVDLGVEGEAVEEGEHEGEAGALAPRREHLSEGGEQQAGGGEAAARRPRLESLPGGRRQGGGAPHETRPVERPGRADQRQLRRGRQVGQPLLPVVPGPAVGLAPLHLPQGQHVIAEGEGKGRERRRGVAVKLGQLAHQQAEAPGVGQQVVEAEVEAHPVAAGAAGADLEQRPAVGREHLVGHALAHGVDLPRGAAGVGPLQVQDLDAVGRDLREDALPAVRQDHRPQHVVAVDQPAPGVLQALDVDPRRLEFQVAVGGDVAHLDRAGAADPVGLLEVGEREGLVPANEVRDQARQGGRRRRVGPTPARRHLARQPAHGAGREEEAQRQVHAAGPLHRGAQAQGEQGVAAEVEEVVLRPDLSEPQGLGEDAGQHGLEGRRRPSSPARAGAGRRRLRGRQGGEVDLVVGGAGQALQEHEGRWHQGRRELPVECGAQLLAGDGGAGARRHPGDQAAALPLAPGAHRGLGDPRVAGERRLHLGRLHPVAAHLDLAVGAAGGLDRAVRPEAAEVAGAVEPVVRPGARQERVAGEALAGEVGIEVAAREIGGADADLPQLGDAGPPAGRVDHQELDAVDAAAERHRPGAPGGLLRRGLDRHRMPAHGLRGLGGAVEVDAGGGGRPAAQPVHVGRGQHVAAEEGVAQIGQGDRRIGRRQHPGEGGGEVDGGHPLLGQPGGEAVGVLEGLAVGHAEGRAQGERGEEVAQQGVVGEAGEQGEAVVRPEPERRRLPRQEVGDRPVVPQDPLGLAGRAGGEGDVGEVRGCDVGERGNPVTRG